MGGGEGSLAKSQSSSFPSCRGVLPPRSSFLSFFVCFLALQLFLSLSVPDLYSPSTTTTSSPSVFVSFSAFPSVVSARAQVVGLDLGSEFVKVALVAAGRPIEILLNNASKRKTSNAVSFADDEKRELGDEGAAQASKKPDRVFLHSNLLLGVNATDYGIPLDQEESKPAAGEPGKQEAEGQVAGQQGAQQYVPFKLTKNLLPSGYPHEYYPYRLYVDKNRNSLAVLARDGVYLPAELVTASMLSYIKKLATQSANVHPDTTIGCVISVPCRYNQRQRQALRDAVEIAGMNPIAFHQHSATAAVQHALDLPSNTTATKLFYDVGSSGIDVGIAQYSPVSLTGRKGSSSSSSGGEVLQVQMLACETVPGAGGHHLDLAIAEKMREIFEKRHPGKELRKTPRALKKLVKQAVMSKHVLSANKQTHFRVEGLHSDVDFHEPIERRHIEDMLRETGFLHKLQVSLNKTLDQAGMSIENIDQVELLGGAWRVPRVQHELSQLMGSGGNTTDVGTHLNGDEAMATGAAFIAANSTVTFRVKKILFSDITPYEYTVRIFSIAEEDDDDSHSGGHSPTDAEEQKKVIRKGDPIEKTKVVIGRSGRLAQGSKTVNIRTKHDFTLQLLEDNIVLDTIAVQGVSQVAEKLIEQAKKAQEEAAKTTPPPEGDESRLLPLPKASIVFKIDATGVITFDRAFLTQDYAVYIPSPTTTTTTTKTPTTTTTTSTTGTDSGESPSSASSTKEADGGSPAEEASTASTTTTAPPPSNVKRVLKHFSDALKADTKLALPLPLTQEQKKSLTAELKAFEESDMRIHRLAEAMNRLESYIYAARSVLEDETIEKVSEESLRAELRKTLERDEDWIYDSAKSEGIDKVKERLRELEDVVEPIKTRAQEYEARPKAIEKMNKVLVDAVSRLEQIATKRPWVPQAKLTDVHKFRDEVGAWWKEKLEAQKARSDKEDPIFTKAEVSAKIKELNVAIKALENIPRPTTTTTTSAPSPDSRSKGKEGDKGGEGEEKKKSEGGEEGKKAGGEGGEQEKPNTAEEKEETRKEGQQGEKTDEPPREEL